MRGGGAGCISATANVNPGPIDKLYREWQNRGRRRAAGGARRHRASCRLRDDPRAEGGRSPTTAATPPGRRCGRRWWRSPPRSARRSRPSSGAPPSPCRDWESKSMQELAGRLNALCDEQPFQTSWYLKDLRDRRRGRPPRRRGGALGQHPQDRDHDGGAAAVHAGKLSLDQPVTIEAKYQDNDSGTFQHLTPGLHDHASRRAGDDDHRQRQHLHRARGRPGRPRAIQRCCEAVGMTRHDASLRHPPTPGPRPHPRSGHDDHAQRSGAAARADPARHDDAAVAARLGSTPELCQLGLDILSWQKLKTACPRSCRSARRSPTRPAPARAASRTPASSSRATGRSSS